MKLVAVIPVLVLLVLVLLVLATAASYKAFAATYQDPRRGFSVDYPDDWYVTEDPATLTTTFKPKVDTDPCKCTLFGVGVMPVSYSYTLHDFIRSMRTDITSSPIINESSTMLAGLPAYQILRDNPDDLVKIVTVSRENVIYGITYDQHATTQLATIQKMDDTFHITSGYK
jgi:hypothetical protein